MYVSVPYICLVPTEIRQGHWIPGVELTDSCEPCGCQKLNPGSLPEQPGGPSGPSLF